MIQSIKQRVLAILEIRCMIIYEIMTSLIRPPEDDDLVNNIRLLMDDCELAAKMARTRARLQQVCKLWQKTFEKIPHPFLILPVGVNATPTAIRVQYPYKCDCKTLQCPMHTPPDLTSYLIHERQINTIIDLSVHSKREVMDIVQNHPSLRVLAISVEFTGTEYPFSLPEFSKPCNNLTHLTLSEFYLPKSDYYQTLHLPSLNTLTLNFFCPGDTVTSGPNMELHPSFCGWNFPRLRNLSLRGWVSNSDSAFFGCIHSMLRGAGYTLRGLLYNLWGHSPLGNAIHPLPSLLWIWCPHLHTIQTSLRVFFRGPTPPPSHPALTIVPVHLGDLDELPTASQMASQLWPRELFQQVREIEWPVERIRISTTWSTFYRKLRGIYEESSLPLQERGRDPTVSYWPTYFCRWINLLLRKGHVVEDRYGVPIDLLNGPAQGLLSWLQGFDWVLVDFVGTW